MANPSTMTVTYLSYSSATPAVLTTSSATVNIPSTGGMAQPDYALCVQNLVRAGGVWITSSTGVATWVPYSDIVLVTVQ